MSAVDLQDPILDSGIRSINFFNGRLLTARDLTREQTANREVDKQLGQAIGDGVVNGFEVSKSRLLQSTTEAPMLTVTSGLAINRRGQTLQLTSDTDIALVREANGNVAALGFNECVPLQTGTFRAGAGVYLLTVAPAQTTEGRAAVSGLDRGIASCNTDLIVSTLQFRLVQLNPPLTDPEVDDESHLRNLVAYKCFGVDDLRLSVTDPFGPQLKQYGLLDSLRSTRLTDCDVPLAVFYWTLAGGVKFIDMWSVRRPPTRLNSTGGWSNFVDDRFRHDGEARFLQFQAQITELRQLTADPRTVAARDNFQYLPAVGVIPRTTGLRLGFEYRRFFQDQTYREPVFIEGARLERLIRDSTAYAPIKLGTGELIYLYEARQNVQATAGGGALIPQSYLIFSSGHMPFCGEARFDVNRYNYSNYSTVYD